MPLQCRSLAFDAMQGALSMRLDWAGGFSNRTKLSFWVYVGVAGAGGLQATVPDITLGISGPRVRTHCLTNGNGCY